MPRARTLLVAALLVLGLAALLDVFVYRAHRHGTTAPPTTPTTAPPPPFGVYRLRVAAAAPFSATLAWTTPEPASTVARYGPVGATPVLWKRQDALSTAHSITLDGLEFSSTYRVRLVTTSAAGERAAASVLVRTQPPPDTPTAGIADGAIVVDGQRIFPLMVYGECPIRYESEIKDGLTLFAGNRCTGLSSQLTDLAGHALSSGTSTDDPSSEGPGLIGWFYPDEADGLGLTGDTLPAPPAGRLRFLTLTNHFYSKAAALPAGKGVYPGLIAKSDVVGFDLYPLQSWCNDNAFHDVFDAQQELVALAQPRPTFQWIEVRVMSCGDSNGLGPTPQTIQAESWLSIAAGAHALGFFPPDWSDQVGWTIRGIANRIRQLGPVLLQPTVAVGIDPAAQLVRASARTLNGALYVIVVNTGHDAVATTLTVPGLDGRVLRVLGQRRAVPSSGDVFRDTLPPLGVGIYVAAPA
ncbi:MAG TPA: fibronectin type III domain-containing protein [Gaiellaceae bacterium]